MSYRAMRCDKCCNGFIEGREYSLHLCPFCNGTAHVLVRESPKTPYQMWCFRWGSVCLILTVLVLLVWRVWP